MLILKFTWSYSAGKIVALNNEEDNIALPALCRKAASDNLFFNVRIHPYWPLHADVVDHPPPQLEAIS